jgi:hypothetical protein
MEEYSPRYEPLRRTNFVAIRGPRGFRPTDDHR